METRINGNSSERYDLLRSSSHSSGKNQEFVAKMSEFSRNEKADVQNEHLQENGKKFKTLNYWGKVRKTAVRSCPTVLQPKNSDNEGDSCDGKIAKKKVLSYDEVGKNFVGCKVEKGGARQVFDERVERERGFTFTGKKSLSNAKFAAKYVGALRNDGRTKVGCDNSDVFDVGEERKKLLKQYRNICKSLERERGNGFKRIDALAYDKLKESGELFINENRPGHVPGVEVEDRFDFRLELVIMGIHSSPIRGIDYMVKPNGSVLATSIVATEGYGDCMTADELIYTGEGGGTSEAKDQELKGGNLALMNSMKEGSFVRVVRGLKSNGSTTTFVYDGLYKVVDGGKKKGRNGKMQYEFRLRRCSGQKPIAWGKYK